MKIDAKMGNRVDFILEETTEIKGTVKKFNIHKKN